MLALWSTTIFIFQFVIGLFGPTVFQLKRVLFSSCINAEHVGRKEGKGYLITHKSHEWAPLDCSHEWEKSDWKVLPCCCFDALIVCLFVWFAIPERSSSAFRKDSRNLFFLFIFSLSYVQEHISVRYSALQFAMFGLRVALFPSFDIWSLKFSC